MICTIPPDIAQAMVIIGSFGLVACIVNIIITWKSPAHHLYMPSLLLSYWEGRSS